MALTKVVRLGPEPSCYSVSARSWLPAARLLLVLGVILPPEAWGSLSASFRTRQAEVGGHGLHLHERDSVAATATAAAATVHAAAAQKHGSSDGDQGGGPGGPPGVGMHDLAIGRARQNLAVAREAEEQAHISARALYASQEQLAAEMAGQAAEETSEKDDPAIPDVKAALEETRRFAIQAHLHAQHAKEAMRAFERLPDEVAKEVMEAVRDWVRKEAYGAAETAGRTLPVEAKGQHAQKVVERVAAAMEPYHFSLLRAQKNMALSEAKAQSAARAANRLFGEASRLAAGAQALQMGGLPGQAVQAMQLAHSTSEEGVNMREWAEKLHAQAEELHLNIPSLDKQLSQVAAAAAQEVGIEVVPVLPERPGLNPGPSPGPAPVPTPAAAAAAAA